MSNELRMQEPTGPQVEVSDLLDCLRKIGKALLASGVSVGVVENTLIEIALIYRMDCEIVVLPNILMIELGHSTHGHVDFAVQRLTTFQLDKASETEKLIDQVKQKKISLAEAGERMDCIFAKKPRFGSGLMIFGYFLSCIGLTMLYRPELRAVGTTGVMGILVALMVVWSTKQPRYNLLLPVFAAAVVSALIFGLTRLGFIYGSANLVVTPLITFLPGAVLTTGMIELASTHIVSGSSRLIYGCAVLMLLYIGVSVGFYISGIASFQVYTYEAVVSPWWAPFLGTTLFGIGTFTRLSGANRDLFWMLLVLYIAILSQTIGERYLNSYFGAFLGATTMTMSSEIIARSPQRTSAVVAQTLAFWFLVPGSLGLLSVTSILRDDLRGAAIGISQVILLIISITLGVLVGTLFSTPQKLTPVDAQSNE